MSDGGQHKPPGSVSPLPGPSTEQCYSMAPTLLGSPGSPQQQCVLPAGHRGAHQGPKDAWSMAMTWTEAQSEETRHMTKWTVERTTRCTVEAETVSDAITRAADPIRPGQPDDRNFQTITVLARRVEDA